MRNYYDELELERTTPTDSLNQALNNVSPELLEDADDLLEILGEEKWRDQYCNVHLQYDAIAAAMSNPALAGSDMQTDSSHQWHKRTVEFEPEQNTIEL